MAMKFINEPKNTPHLDFLSHSESAQSAVACEQDASRISFRESEGKAIVKGEARLFSNDSLST